MKYIIVKQTISGIEKAVSETYDTQEDANEVLSECSPSCFILETYEDELEGYGELVS